MFNTLWYQQNLHGLQVSQPKLQVVASMYYRNIFTTSSLTHVQSKQPARVSKSSSFLTSNRAVKHKTNQSLQVYVKPQSNNAVRKVSNSLISSRRELLSNTKLASVQRIEENALNISLKSALPKVCSIVAKQPFKVTSQRDVKNMNKASFQSIASIHGTNGPTRALATNQEMLQPELNTKVKLFEYDSTSVGDDLDSDMIVLNVTINIPVKRTDDTLNLNPSKDVTCSAFIQDSVLSFKTSANVKDKFQTELHQISPSKKYATIVETTGKNVENPNQYVTVSAPCLKEECATVDKKAQSEANTVNTVENKDNIKTEPTPKGTLTVVSNRNKLKCELKKFRKEYFTTKINNIKEEMKKFVKVDNESTKKDEIKKSENDQLSHQPVLCGLNGTIVDIKNRKADSSIRECNPIKNTTFQGSKTKRSGDVVPNSNRKESPNSCAHSAVKFKIKPTKLYMARMRNQQSRISPSLVSTGTNNNERISKVVKQWRGSVDEPSMNRKVFSALNNKKDDSINKMLIANKQLKNQQTALKTIKSLTVTKETSDKLGIQANKLFNYVSHCKHSIAQRDENIKKKNVLRKVSSVSSISTVKSEMKDEIKKDVQVDSPKPITSTEGSDKTETVNSSRSLEEILPNAELKVSKSLPEMKSPDDPSKLEKLISVDNKLSKESKKDDKKIKLTKLFNVVANFSKRANDSTAVLNDKTVAKQSETVNKPLTPTQHSIKIKETITNNTNLYSNQPMADDKTWQICKITNNSKNKSTSQEEICDINRRLNDLDYESLINSEKYPEDLISIKTTQFCNVLLELVKLFAIAAIKDIEKVKRKATTNDKPSSW